MTEITAALVKQLREATNVSMMECKRALVEAGGDMERATRVLRERGIAVAAKKATRVANQGLVATASAEGGVEALIEINCETDFVARNADFIGFVADLALAATATDEPLADKMQEQVTAKVAEIGENIVVRHSTRFVPQGAGVVASYIHLGGKVGVLLELGCEKDETPGNEIFTALARDLTLHVAACNPRFLTSDEVPADEAASERELYAKQVEGKPPQIVDKIVEGKIQKYFGEICLVDQGFVKEPKQSITSLLQEKEKELGDRLCIRRFVRYQIGA